MIIKPNQKELQYMGRIDKSDPDAFMMIYPASLVTVRFRGTEISALLENHWQFWGNYMGVLVDGVQSSICLTEGGNEKNTEVRSFCLAKNLPDGEHTVTLFKRQDSCHKVLFHGFELPDGSEVLEPAPLPKRKMEVYGDSVSAGEVAEAVEYTGKADPEHNGEYSNVWYSYAWLTARKLNAQLHDVAQGGIALLDGTGYFNAPELTGMENTWDKMQYNPVLGEVTMWDFARYTPDVVVVAIGQNDANPDDCMKNDYRGGKADVWRAHYKQFVENIRGKYPQSLIVLATTILNHDKGWDDAIEEVCGQIGDPKIVHFYYKRNGCGTPGHIRIGEAEEMAQELSAFIEERIG